MGESRQTLARVEAGERLLDSILREQVLQAHGEVMAEARRPAL